MIKHAQRLRLALGAAVVSAGLVCASLAVAAPRPSGSATAPAPEAPAAATAPAGGTYTRSDMPRPSGAVTPVGLESASAPAEAPATPSKLPEKVVAAASGEQTAGEAVADDGWSPDMDCTTCHNPDDVKAATEDSVVLTDVNGTVVNPHDLPAVEDHAGITCASCHKSHEVSESTEKSAKRTCASCHHADVYECYTCHA